MIIYDLPSKSALIATAISTFALLCESTTGLLCVAFLRKASQNNVQRRFISAIVIACMFSLCMWLGGLPFAVFIAAVSWLSASELLRLLADNRPSIFGLLTHVATVTIIAAAVFESQTDWANASFFLHSSITDLVTFFWVMIFLLVPVAAGRFFDMPANEAKSTLVTICTGWVFANFILLRNAPGGFGAAMFLVLCVVANDTFAFISGSLIGRVKLSALSPKKTVEGCIGGTLATLLTAVNGLWLIPQIQPTSILALALLISGLAPCGDLAMSAIKRNAGVKDSGILIPGHGGVLDRMGSFILITPVFYYLYHFLITVARQAHQFPTTR